MPEISDFLVVSVPLIKLVSKPRGQPGCKGEILSHTAPARRRIQTAPFSKLVGSPRKHVRPDGEMAQLPERQSLRNVSACVARTVCLTPPAGSRLLG